LTFNSWFLPIRILSNLLKASAALIASGGVPGPFARGSAQHRLTHRLQSAYIALGAEHTC
jgi:hypothetical protein